VTRVASGAVLVVVAIALVWFAPAAVFALAGAVVVLLACHEYLMLARASGFDLPGIPVAAAVVLTYAAFAPLTWAGAVIAVPIDLVLLTSFVALAALTLPRWRGGHDALGAAAASVFPLLYLALPVGTLASIRETRGPNALFLLMLTVMVSDTAQYYSGRLFGRRPLAAAISPKKTVEGAVGGFIFGALLMAVAGAWWLPSAPIALRAALGLALVALGIAGDLFESMLKRSAGVKDSSALIPGHGGVLDRIDALLFAAPVYYIVLKYV
jgi:phosphatidate cytidylyltransferase